LPREEAQRLVASIARDLARLFGDLADLDLVLSAACHDPAELMRPGWPIHRSLGQLAEISPGETGRVMAFARSGEGFAAPELAPDPALSGGPLQVVPLLLAGASERIAALGARMESELLERGMAGAEVALEAQQLMGLPLEHARYMSLNDLCAMTAMQYGHAGLEAVWQLVEGGLFDPAGNEFLLEDGLPPLHRDGLDLRLGSEDLAAWNERHGAGLDADALARRWSQWPARLRQVESVLAAHGLACRRVELGANDDAERVLRSASS